MLYGSRKHVSAQCPRAGCPRRAARSICFVCGCPRPLVTKAIIDFRPPWHPGWCPRARRVSAGLQNKSLHLRVLDCPFSSSLLLAFLVNLVLLPSSASLVSLLRLAPWPKLRFDRVFIFRMSLLRRINTRPWGVAFLLTHETKVFRVDSSHRLTLSS